MESMSTEQSTVITPRSDKTGRFCNPLTVAGHFWQYRDLIRQLTWREVMGRYKNSFFGFSYALIIPLVMLAIYTFVFSVIFQAKWGMGASGSFFRLFGETPPRENL